MRRNDAIGFAELHVQQRITNRLLAAQLRTTMKQVELVKLLASTGATTAEIADVVGTTAGTVKTALQRFRKSDKAVDLPGDTDEGIKDGGTDHEA
jgi:DNA-directed RNA polymerase specialized sigma24 family protein